MAAVEKNGRFDSPESVGYVRSVTLWSVDRGAGIEDASLILWDVVDEHLDEAEFTLEQFARALESPTLTLQDLANLEATMAAHVDALVVGGTPVCDKLISPLLTDPESSGPRTILAALTLVSAGRAHVVVGALASAPGLARIAVERGIELGVSGQVDVALNRAMTRAPGADRAALLRVAYARHMDVGSVVSTLAGEDQPERAAAIAVASLVDAQELPWIEYALSSADPAIRDAAMLRGLEYGSSSAWSVCQSLALRTPEPHPTAMALVAGLGDQRHHDELVILAQSKTHGSAARRALGYSGNCSLVPWLIQESSLDDESSAKLAAEAISMILHAPGDLIAPERNGKVDQPDVLEPVESDEEAMNALPPIESDDLVADIVPPAEDELPKPDSAAVGAWWEANRSRFDVRVRYLAGIPLSLVGFRKALEVWPLRRRHLLSMLLSIRTARAFRVNTRSFPSVQRAQQGSIPAAPQAAWAHQYTAF